MCLHTSDMVVVVQNIMFLVAISSLVVIVPVVQQRYCVPIVEFRANSEPDRYMKVHPVLAFCVCTARPSG